MVPVMRNAETLSFRGVEAEIKRLALRARDGQITVDEMTGGTFTFLMVVFWKYVVYTDHQSSTIRYFRNAQCSRKSYR